VNSARRFFPKLPFVFLRAAVLVLALVAIASAQDPAASVADDRDGMSSRPGEQLSAHPTNDQSRKLSIGPGDELDVSVYGVPELSQHVRVDISGDVHLLLIDPTHVEGLSSEEAQAVIEKQLVEGRFVKNPHVSVFLKEFTNQSISVIGEVNKPGSYPALTTRRLYDAFQEAGGLTPTAGKVSITHSGQPNKPTVITLSNDPIKSTQANVEIMPGDAITVSRAPVVYVIGEVNKPGGYVLHNDSNIEGTSPRLTVMQVVVLASGPVRGAALNKSRLIRRATNGLQEVPIHLKEIMAGKAPDPFLQAEDILYIPGGRSSTVSAVLSTLTTAAIYRIP
jgi:polysaccharide export outer membrane protein